MAGAFLATSLAAGVTTARSASLARIAFGSGGRIFTIAADGSGRTQVSGGARPWGGRADDFAPAWAPDGTKLAFARSFPLGRYDERSQIYLVDSDGTDQEPLTAPEPVYDADPQWSPDGERLVFTRFVSTRSEFTSSIVVIDNDGSDEHTIARRRLGPDWVFLGEPSWSPDGARIAFTKTTLDRHYYFRPSLWTVDPEGTDQQLLRRDASAAAWSPDGSQIAFASIRDHNGSDCGSDECWYFAEIYAMDADGTDPVRLTHNMGDDYEPDWSADGQRIVFASDRNYPAGRDPELYSIEPDGSCLTWLTNGSPGSASPDWEPDAQASTDPGACGPTARPPLIEFDATPALDVAGYPVFWLGKRFRNMLLSYVYVGRRATFFGYDDCASFSPRDCGPIVDLQNRPVCAQTLLPQAGAADRLVKRRGALVAYSGFLGGLKAYTGRTEAKIYLSGPAPERLRFRGHLRVFRRLRRVQESEPSATLRQPAIPRPLFRRLRRAEDAYLEAGSIAAAADDLGMSKGRLHHLLRLFRALDRFGDPHVIRCPDDG